MPSISSLPHQTSPLRPIDTASSRRNIFLNAAPYDAPQRSSPSRRVVRKSDTHDGFAREKAASAGRDGSGLGPQKARYTTPSNYRSAGKENSPNESGEGMYPVDMMYGQEIQSKHNLVQSKKQKPNPESSWSAVGPFGAFKDDGTKPSQSYAMLIGLAIVTAPEKRLTLTQIYKWISDTFSYYSAAETGWQNSIRHNLSLNKAFVKMERPTGEPGKGKYWVIAAGKEEELFRDKQLKRRSIIESGPNASASDSLPSPPMREPPPSLCKNSTVAPVGSPPLSTDSLMPIQPATTDDNKLSSDASDTYRPDEITVEDEPYEYDGAAKPILSFLSALRQSSPLVPRRDRLRGGTPHPIVSFAHSSAQRSHNLKSIDYSRYFNSSAVCASVPHRHRIKGGRAEDEIARLRGRKLSCRSRPAPRAKSLMSSATPSSPFHDLLYEDVMLPPLTPAVKLTAPSHPPPHPVSPNTNLRLHRERVRQLVGSPMRDAKAADHYLAEPLLDVDTECQMFVNAVLKTAPA